MTKKKQLGVFSLMLLAVMAFLLAIVCGISFRAKADEDTLVFDSDVTFRTEYGAGYALVIPTIEARLGEEVFPVSAVLTYGSEVAATLHSDETSVKYRLNRTGEYILTYTCEVKGEMYTKSFEFEVKDMPYFEHTLSSVYSLGAEIPLDAVAVYKGERVKAAAEVNGAAASGSYRAASLGALEVTFKAEIGGKTYTETSHITIRVKGYDDLFIAGTGISTVTPNEDAPAFMREGNGVKIMAGSVGSVARWSNVINLNALDSTVNLIKFVPLSGGDYAALKQVIIRLVDVHDPSNTVQWRFYSISWDSGSCTSYCGFNYDGREMGRFNEAGSRFGEVRSDWMTQMPNGTFDFITWAQPDRTNVAWFAAQADYSQKQFFVNSEMPAGAGNWLILDADDSDQVGVGKEWKGFTTGEVWLEVIFDGSGKTGVIVSEVAGQSLAGETIVDTTAPYVITEYSDDAHMPVGSLSQSYPVPAPARVLDTLEGELDPDVVNIRLLYIDGFLARDVSSLLKDGAFVPDKAGVYRIEYSATDSAGNTSKRYVEVTISAENAPIEVSCDLPQTAFVGETLTLPDVKVTGMTTLTERTIQFMYNGKALDVVPGQDLLLQEAGELTLYYKLTDYVNNTRSATLKTTITVSADPVITVRGVPYTAIRGRTLLLPDFTAYDYNYGESDARHEPMKSIFVNGKSVNIDSRAYEVTEKAGTELKVEFCAGKTRVAKTISVIEPQFMTDYFMTSSVKSTVNTEEYAAFRFSGELTAKTVNPCVVNNFAGFPAVFEADGNGIAELWLTDYLRPYKSVFLRVDTARRTMTINGEGTEYTLKNGSIEFRYKSNGKLIVGYGVIKTWTDGTAFDGFEGGVAVPEWKLYGFDESELRLYRLGMTRLGSTMKNGAPQAFIDNAVPSIVFSDEIYQNTYTIGRALIVPHAEAWSAMSGTCEVRVNLYNAEGDVVIDNALANRDYYYTIDSFGIWLIEYHVTYANGAVSETSLPIDVRNLIPPTVALNGEIAESYKAGSKIKIPTLTVSTTGDYDAYVSVVAPDGRIANYNLGDEVTFEQKGTYKITFIVSDEWNYTVKHYKVTVR